jgi:hypothetical protein
LNLHVSLKSKLNQDRKSYLTRTRPRNGTQLLYLFKNSVKMIDLFHPPDRPRPPKPVLHSDTGSSGVDGGRLLANDLGAGLRRHRHAHQAPRQRAPALPEVLARGGIGAVSHL